MWARLNWADYAGSSDELNWSGLPQEDIGENLKTEETKTTVRLALDCTGLADLTLSRLGG